MFSFQWMTKEQHRIVTHSCGFFRALATQSTMVRSFDPAGGGVSVALTHREDGHFFVVRETIPEFSTMGHIYDVCDRLLFTMASSYAKTKTMLKIENGD